MSVFRPPRLKHRVLGLLALLVGLSLPTTVLLGRRLMERADRSERDGSQARTAWWHEPAAGLLAGGLILATGGLGLAVFRHLADLLRGWARLHSAPGRGTTAWFEADSAPAEREAEVVPPAEVRLPTTPAEVRLPTAGRAGRPGRILVAEDDPDNQEIARLFLEQAGHRVVVVDNGGAAVLACRATTFDLILMDLHMPAMDGPEAARCIRAEQTSNSNKPILAMTASADDDQRRECLAAGLNDLLAKPIRRAALLAAVQRWLDPQDPAAAEAAQPTESPPEAVSAPLNWERAIREFGGWDVLAGLLPTFLFELDRQLEELGARVTARELAELRRGAHRLRGAALSTEAGPLAELAARLEHLAAETPWPAVERLVDELRVEAERVRATINERLATGVENADAQSGD